MTYDVLSDDLYESSDSKPEPSKKKSNGGDKKKFKFNPLYIHIAILLLIFIPLLLYIFSDFSFNFGDKESTKTTLTLVGDIDNFSKEYIGVLKINSAEFDLETISGNYHDTSKDIVINGFSGNIYENNISIVFEGVANNMSYGKNFINLRETQFKLISMKKTVVDLLIPQINLNFKEGRFILGDNLNYEFENSTVNIINYNTTMSFDGTYSFSGTSDEFKLNALENKLEINFKEIDDNGENADKK